MRITIADDDAETREFLRHLLPTLGHEIVSVAENGAQLVQQCKELKPDLVITDITMPDMDGVQAAEQINRETPIPIVLVSGFAQPELVERTDDYIMAYLLKPVQKQELELAISIARRRFDHFQELHREAADLRQALADRKIVERAKGILMKRAELDEDEAFRRLQKLASEKNRKLAEIAKIIVTADEAMHGEKDKPRARSRRPGDSPRFRQPVED